MSGVIGCIVGIVLGAIRSIHTWRFSRPAEYARRDPQPASSGLQCHLGKCQTNDSGEAIVIGPNGCRVQYTLRKHQVGRPDRAYYLTRNDKAPTPKQVICDDSYD